MKATAHITEQWLYKLLIYNELGRESVVGLVAHLGSLGQNSVDQAVFDRFCGAHEVVALEILLDRLDAYRREAPPTDAAQTRTGSSPEASEEADA